MKHFFFQRKQFLLYCLIGGSGTALTCLIYAALVKYAVASYQTANAIGYAAGTLSSFILNTCFNFQVSNKLALRLVSFCGVAFIGWLVSAGLLALLVGQWAWNAYYAYVVVIISVVLLQYNLNRWVSFRKTI